MKTYRIIVLFAVLYINIGKATSQGVVSASSDRNYIHTRAMTNESGSTYLDVVEYFDGLGRAEQSVQVRITPSGSDLVSYQEYDAAGRVAKQWLPGVISNSNGAYQMPSSATSASIINNIDNAPYAMTYYENSPLNRPIKEIGTGNEWHSAGVGTNYAYLTNAASSVDLGCALYSAPNDRTSVQVIRNGNHAANQLFVTKTISEDGNVSYEFRNKLDQTVLTRQQDGATYFNTYYVYDVYGNLRAVLPPLAADALSANTTYGESTTAIQQYAYLYKYDVRNRCIAKKLPGADWIYYVYDQGDQLIFMQDGVLRGSGKWHFSIPDAFGRVVLSGLCTNSLSYTSNPLNGTTVKATWENSTTTHKGYYLSGVTLSEVDIQSVFYYDQYQFISMNGVPASMNKGSRAAYDVSTLTSPMGLLTGASFQQPGTTTHLYEAYYYDLRGRQVQTRRTNHLGGVDHDYFRLTFDGLPQKRFHELTVSGTTHTEEYVYTYDNARRLTKTTHSLNGAAAVTLSEKSYDNLGRLLTDKKGNNDTLKTTYAYDVRSRLKSQAEYGFSQSLVYSYGGNITTQSWDHFSGPRSYTYSYDGLSRIIDAAHQQSSDDDDYSASYSYDKHGNPLTITGEGSAFMYDGPVDDITLSYTGNRLKKVTDNVPGRGVASYDFLDQANQEIEYTYDQNGNITKDLNSGISAIQYNTLNLSARIDIKSQYGEARNDYSYKSDGVKLRVHHRWNPNYNYAPVIGSGVTESALTASQTTDYVRNFIYVDNALKRILTENGYIENNQYIYYIKDHLGSVRSLSSFKNKGLNLDYYPYGMLYGASFGIGSQPYAYTGKELDIMHRLNLHDYGARFYDAALGRFITMDPLAEKYYSWSPYNYCGNNPINRIDPDGLAWVVEARTFENIDRSVQLGYKWVDEGDSYDLNKNLLEGYYAQAIFFSHNGTFDASKDKNIGSSTAYVYLANGEVQTFDANTFPSDLEQFATVPEGIYEASVGKHQGRYEALKMRDVGAKQQRIELGVPNPAYNDGRTYAEGINIHMAGDKNLTGMFKRDGKYRAVSEGCLLIDRPKWNEFIGNFTNEQQRNNKVSITVSRSIAKPIIKTKLWKGQ